MTASIVTYKTKESDLIQVIKCALRGGVHKIWVVDNSPTEQLKHSVSNYTQDKVVYLWGHGNIGYGAGHNIALKLASECDSKYHVVLNPDIYFEDNVLFALKTFMDNHDDAGSVMPKVYYPNGKLQYLCKLNPTPMDILGRRLLPSRWIKQRNNRFEMRTTGYNAVRNVPILSGCFMFLRLKSIKEVGMFDDRYFMYFEDFDLIRRIHMKYKTVYYPDVSIIHNHAAEHKINRKLLNISIKSAIKYFNKWGWFFDSYRRAENIKAFDTSNLI